MLRVTIQESGDTAVLRCEGRLVLGEELSTLFNSVVFQRDEKLIVLDTTGVKQIDARGLGALVLLKDWLRGTGAKLLLVPSKPVRNLLSLTGLTHYFEIKAERPTRVDQFIGHQQENEIVMTGNGHRSGTAD